MIDFNYPEGATPIDPDEVGGLLLSHITTQGELNRWKQDNIVDALAWIEKRKPTDILNEQFIKQLHKRMFGKDALQRDFYAEMCRVERWSVRTLRPAPLTFCLFPFTFHLLHP